MLLRREMELQVHHLEELERENLNQKLEIKMYEQKQTSIRLLEEEKHIINERLSSMETLREQVISTQQLNMKLQSQIDSWGFEEMKKIWGIESLSPEIVRKKYMELTSQLQNMKQMVAASEEKCNDYKELFEQQQKALDELSQSKEDINIKYWEEHKEFLAFQKTVQIRDEEIQNLKSQISALTQTTPIV